jgi:hypothetical protein
MRVVVLQPEYAQSKGSDAVFVFSLPEDGRVLLRQERRGFAGAKMQPQESS